MPPPKRSRLTSKLVQDALDGNRGAQRLLVEELTPFVLNAVTRALGKRQRFSHGEAKDLVQQVFIRLLYGADVKYLRQWDPVLGYAFISIRIRWTVATLLRQKQLKVVLLTPEDLEKLSGEDESHEARARAELQEQVLLELRATLKPRELAVLELLLKERPASEICRELNMPSESSVYSLRQRIVQKAQEIARRLLQ